MKKLILMSTFLLIGCETHSVRQDDLNSWNNQSTVTLEKHPFFSPLHREERSLSNGESIINFTVRRTVSEAPPQCLGSRDRRFRSSFDDCSRREITEKNCVHQFIIRSDRVVSYQVLGDSCYTTCQNRPNPSNCPK